MVLGEMVEALTGSNLDRFCQDRIFKPLGLRSTAFVDLTKLRTRRLQPVKQTIAPTENCPWRKRILCGEVHDDNAYAMGGVAGHAGLFSSAAAIDALLCPPRARWRGEGTLVGPAPTRGVLTRPARVPPATLALRLGTPTPGTSRAR